MHAGGLSGGYAGLGIFDDETFFGLNMVRMPAVEPRQCRQIGLGVGLVPAHLVAADQDIEMLADAAADQEWLNFPRSYLRKQRQPSDYAHVP